VKVAVYLRVSTDEQRERHSIETQRELAIQYCGQRAMEIADFYADDGISGTIPLDGRAEGRRMLEDARTGKFDSVLVYKLDRLGREPRLTLDAVYDLKNLGIGIASIYEALDSDTPAGKFGIIMHSAVAGLERDTIMQRSADGIARLVRGGAWVGGVAPYGYRVQGKHTEARLVVSDVPVQKTGLTESDVIRLIFRMAGEDGKSCMVIAEHLNSIGVPPASPRAEDGSPRGKRGRFTAALWRDSRVLFILRSPTYRGVHLYGKRCNNPSKKPQAVERAVPAIIDSGLWERAQQTLVRNRFFSKRNSHHEYLLRGLAKCGHCGSTFIGTVYTGAKRPTRKAYVCGGRHKGRRAVPDPALRCRNSSIAGDIEDVIWADVERFLRNPQAVIETLTARLQETGKGSPSVDSRLLALRTALTTKDIEHKRVVTLYRRGQIDDADVDEQIAEIDRERKGLEAEIGELESTAQNAQEVQAQLLTTAGVLETLNARLDRPLDVELKRQIVRTLVEGVLVETSGEGAEKESVVRVTYRFGVPDPSIDPRTPRGIRDLQSLALPLGHAASRRLGGECSSGITRTASMRAGRLRPPCALSRCAQRNDQYPSTVPSRIRIWFVVRASR
jgi:site-specific DNA recombinase